MREGAVRDAVGGPGAMMVHFRYTSGSNLNQNFFETTADDAGLRGIGWKGLPLTDFAVMGSGRLEMFALSTPS